MSSIMVICPYNYYGTWVFDDADAGLVREAFVAGIDKMIDLLVADIPSAQRGFKMLFSNVPFPRHSVVLEWIREDCGGNWYYSEKFGIEGWLCPALFKYFDYAPSFIYVQATEKEE